MIFIIKHKHQFTVNSEIYNINTRQHLNLHQPAPNLTGFKHGIYYSGVKIYRVSQEECARLKEGVAYVKVYRYNPKHLCPKLNGYGDNGQRSLKL